MPDEAGVYFWSLDISAAILGGDADTIDAEFARELGPSRGRAGLFYTVAVSEASTPLSGDKRTKLADLPNEGPLRDWVAWVSTVYQRPLYIGKAGNLYTRLQQHLAEDSRLRQYLREMAIRIEDCSFVYSTVPVRVNDELAAVDEDHGGNTPDDDDVYDEGLNDDTSWNVSAIEHPDLAAVDLAESLAIKLGRPITGKRRG